MAGRRLRPEARGRRRPPRCPQRCVGIRQVQWRAPLDQVHVGLPVRLDRAHVAPVVEILVPEHAPPPEDAGHDVLSEIVRAGLPQACVLLQRLDEYVPPEAVDAHRNPGRSRHRRLLLEVHNPPARIHLQHPETVRLLQRDCVCPDRHVRPLPPVVRDEVAVRHQVDVVRREDQHLLRPRLRDQVEVLVDRICGPLVPVHVRAPEVGLQDLDVPVGRVEPPRAPRGDVVHERPRTVLRQYGHAVDIARRAVAECEVDDAVLPPEHHRRLRALLREHRQAVALPAR